MKTIFNVKNHVGHILLNRPNSLNSINHETAALLLGKLQEWATDSHVHAIVIQGAGNKVFSAGGDLKEIYTLQKNKDLKTLELFFTQEYLLNALIHNYPKPYISLMNGITMGGGMGLAVHGSHKVVTENSTLAMPENRIGLFPDVGAAYFLNQCPGHLGMFLALTGYYMSPEDAIFSGLATNYIPEKLIPTLISTLESSDLSKAPYESITDILESYTNFNLDRSILEQYRPQIDEIFSLRTVEEIMEELNAQKDKFWYQILDHMETLCPISLKVTHHLMKWAVRKPLMEVIKMDYHLSQQFLKHPNFQEGIRARLIDKDNTPRWQPESLPEVSKEIVEEYFC